MKEKPYVPFYPPYGMTDEEYQYEVMIAKDKLAEWEAEQEEIECICVDFLNGNPDPIANPDCPIHGSWTNAFANQEMK